MGGPRRIQDADNPASIWKLRSTLPAPLGPSELFRTCSVPQVKLPPRAQRTCLLYEQPNDQ